MKQGPRGQNGDRGSAAPEDRALMIHIGLEGGPDHNLAQSGRRDLRPQRPAQRDVLREIVRQLGFGGHGVTTFSREKNQPNTNP